MKPMKRFMAALLVASLMLFAVSCESSEQKAYDKVNAYLAEKYNGMEFEVGGYTQDLETSGKYTFNVTCQTTGIEFEVIMSSLMTSDSYQICYANAQIREEIYDLLGTAKDLTCVENIQCFDRYDEEAGTYRFRDFTEEALHGLDDISSLYRVKLSGVQSPNDAAQCVYMFCDVLYAKGVLLDKITFDFILDGEPILFTTNTNTVEGLDSFEPLEELFTAVKAPSAANSIFYREPGSDVKVIDYIRD